MCVHGEARAKGHARTLSSHAGREVGEKTARRKADCGMEEKVRETSVAACSRVLRSIGSAGRRDREGPCGF